MMTPPHADSPRLVPSARSLGTLAARLCAARAKARRPGALALVALLVAAACSGSARAEPPTAAARSGPVQQTHESPYTVDLLGGDGRMLSTYEHRGRYYVLGEAGERYTVRVRNPTSRRVEAVIAVDGLDAIDGEPADYASKRGYIVPARGEVRIDGFRVSEKAVAAFRFSSVADSYAGRKGRARNVGVVGVAIFAEARRDPLVLPEPDRPRPHPAPRGPRRGGSAGEPAPEADGPAAGGARAPRGEAEDRAAPRRSRERQSRRRCCADDRDRPGLGTGWGERRRAPITWTRFERADSRQPTAIAELRYNDRAGLVALGIPLEPTPGQRELHKRETASPFPFARPPGHR